MSGVFAIFENYNNLLTKFDSKTIYNRYEGLLNRYKTFISESKLDEYVFINELVLQHAVLDYYSDIGRLKEYHNIELTNKVKVISYESYWLWRRKPLQLKIVSNEAIKNKDYVYSNELFVYTNILSYLTEDITDEKYNYMKTNNLISDINSFMQTMYYYLKFRQCNPQVFELTILAFLAGKQFFKMPEQPLDT